MKHIFFLQTKQFFETYFLLSKVAPLLQQYYHAHLLDQVFLKNLKMSSTATKRSSDSGVPDAKRANLNQNGGVSFY